MQNGKMARQLTFKQELANALGTGGLRRVMDRFHSRNSGLNRTNGYRPEEGLELILHAMAGESHCLDRLESARRRLVSRTARELFTHQELVERMPAMLERFNGETAGFCLGFLSAQGERTLDMTGFGNGPEALELFIMVADLRGRLLGAPDAASRDSAVLMCGNLASAMTGSPIIHELEPAPSRADEEAGREGNQRLGGQDNGGGRGQGRSVAT